MSPSIQHFVSPLIVNLLAQQLLRLSLLDTFILNFPDTFLSLLQQAPSSSYKATFIKGHPFIRSDFKCNDIVSKILLNCPLQELPLLYIMPLYNSEGYRTNAVSSKFCSGEVYSIQHYMIKFVSDLHQVGSFPM